MLVETALGAVTTVHRFPGLAGGPKSRTSRNQLINSKHRHGLNGVE